jgi:hypothetical protein
MLHPKLKMKTYKEAKEYLINNLTRDVERHLNRDFDAIGDGFGHFDTMLPRNNDPNYIKLHIALNFWDGWQDARNHDWHYYEGIRTSDWPNLAKIIIQNLKNDEEITNDSILKHFNLRPRQGIIKKIKKIFKAN